MYLSAPAADGKAAWDAAFFVTSLWHPSYALYEAMSGRGVATQSALEWGVERLAPEWAIVYALPRALRGESVAALLDRPFRGGFVNAPRELAVGGAPTGHEPVERVGKSRFVKQWGSLRRSRKMVGDGHYVNFEHETAGERDADPAFQAKLQHWRTLLGDKGFVTFVSNGSLAARLLNDDFDAKLEHWRALLGD